MTGLGILAGSVGRALCRPVTSFNRQREEPFILGPEWPIASIQNQSSIQSDLTIELDHSDDSRTDIARS
jgi:hypothetical protein